MYKIYKDIHNVCTEIDGVEPNCWVNFVDPTPSELDFLENNFSIDRGHLNDALDPEERARIEQDEDTLVIILKLPVRRKTEEDTRYLTVPLGIFLKEGMIITLCRLEHAVVTDFLEGKVKHFDLNKRSRFLLQILFRTATYYLRDLKEIRNLISDLEQRLHRSQQNQHLIKLLELEKGLVYYATSLSSNELIFERLHRSKFIPMYEDDVDLLEDVLIENKQAIDMVTVYTNILSGMMDAYASIISNNLNKVMKTLTAITIILMLPTLVASFFGMNVELPFQHSPSAFLLTIGISLVFSLIAFFLFIFRKWF